MIDLDDGLMYLKYFKKSIYLEFLKIFKGLDYTGRIEHTDKRLRGYEGCYPVSDVFNRLKITKLDTILDIGCGKGLFIYYALKYPFTLIDGIEYSVKLVDIAKYNAKKAGDKRVHIYHSDARKFTEYEKYNYYFVNNPFNAEIMEQVVIKLKESYLKKKRKIIVIYQFPFNITVFKKHGFEILYEKFPNSILTFG